MKKLLSILLSMVLLLSLFISGCSNKEVDVVGEVNGESITTENYESHLSFLQYFYELQSGTNLDEEKDQAVIDTLKSQTFDDLVLERILHQEAKKEGIVVTEKEIKEELTKIQSSYSEENYKKLLKDMGMTENQLKEQIKTQIIYAALKEKLVADVTISEQEVQQYYQDNIDIFVEQGGIQLSHILVDTEKEAEEILAKLEQGDDFASLAREFSSCPSSSQGGDLGLLNQDSNFVTEFKDAALQLKPGGITPEPVESEFGFHIIKAGERQEARTIPLEEIEKSLHQQLLEDKKLEFFYSYLEDLQEKADIKDWRQDKPEKD